MTQTGYDGLGYCERETIEFQDLFEHLKVAIDRNEAARVPEKAAELLMEMDKDPDLFWRRINISNTGDSSYASFPILAAIEPISFVDHLLRHAPKIQQSLLMALQSRYVDGRLEQAFPSEVEWVFAIRRELETRFEGMRPIGKRRLERFIRWHLDPICPVETSSILNAAEPDESAI